VGGGRSILGLGGAWFGLEHQAHGIDFGSGFGERLDWLDEAVGSIRALLDGHSVTSAGGRYRFSDLRHSPLPIQDHLPLMIGGGGERKTLRTVARYADIWNVFGSPEEVRRKDAILRLHCQDVGRDPDAFERSVTLRIIVRDSEDEARRVAETQARHNRSHPRQGTVPVLGTPAMVARHLSEYAAAGFTTIICEMASPYDPETIDRLAGEVRPLVEAGSGR